MKKIALLTIAGLATASLAHAQSGFRLGIRVGGTLSTIGGKNSDQVAGPNGSADINYLPGFNAGLSFQLPLSSDGFWTLAPELLVNRKGFKRSYQITDRNTLNTRFGAEGANIDKFESEGKRNFTYIDLPIPVRINTAPGGSGLYFELGPQVGYMARSSQEFTETTKYVNTNTKDKVSSPEGDYKEDLSSFDIGGVAGLGYQTEGGLSLGVRYNQGFKTLFDTKDVSARNEPKAFNRQFTVQLGYLLPLGK